MKCCAQIPGGKLEALKEQIYKQTVDTLHSYRDKVARTAASGQLILPESLKLLPLYALALSKASAFRSFSHDPQCTGSPCTVIFRHVCSGWPG